MNWGSFFEGLSTVLGAYDKYESGREAKKEASAEADAAEKRAALDRERAKDATRRGVMESERANQRRRALIGKQRAAMGASGVQVGKGSFANILADTNAAGAEDEDTILQNAMRESWGYTARADQSQSEARNMRRAGRKAGQAGLLGGLGSLASGTYQFGANPKRNWW